MYLWIICEMESQFKQHASSGERPNLGLKYEPTWSNLPTRDVITYAANLVNIRFLFAFFSSH